MDSILDCGGSLYLLLKGTEVGGDWGFLYRVNVNPDSCYGETGNVDICYYGGSSASFKNTACCTGCWDPDTVEWDKRYVED